VTHASPRTFRPISAHMPHYAAFHLAAATLPHTCSRCAPPYLDAAWRSIPSDVAKGRWRQTPCAGCLRRTLCRILAVTLPSPSAYFASVPWNAVAGGAQFTPAYRAYDYVTVAAPVLRTVPLLPFTYGLPRLTVYQILSVRHPRLPRLLLCLHARFMPHSPSAGGYATLRDLLRLPFFPTSCELLTFWKRQKDCAVCRTYSSLNTISRKTVRYAVLNGSSLQHSGHGISRRHAVRRLRQNIRACSSSSLPRTAFAISSGFRSSSTRTRRRLRTTHA